MESPKTKTRKSNWADDEVRLLTELCSSTQLESLSKDSRRRFWEECAEKINAISMAGRTWTMAKKRWSDMKSSTKKKVTEGKAVARGTGGGPPMSQLTELEDKVLNCMPPVVTEGIMATGDIFSDRLEEPLPVLDDPQEGTSAVREVIADCPQTSRYGKKRKTTDEADYSSKVLVLMERKIVNKQRQHEEMMRMKGQEMELMKKQLKISMELLDEQKKTNNFLIHQTERINNIYSVSPVIRF